MNDLDTLTTTHSAHVLFMKEERKRDSEGYVMYMVTYSSQMCVSVLVLVVSSFLSLNKFLSFILTIGAGFLFDISLKIAYIVKFRKENDTKRKSILRSWVEVLSCAKDSILLILLVLIL